MAQDFFSNKRIVVLLAWIMYFVLPANAQTSNPKWEKRFSVLYARSTANTDSTLKAAKAWLNELGSTGDVFWKSKALCIVGRCQYLNDSYEEAEASFQQSLSWMEDGNDQEVIGLCCNYLAMLRYRIKKYDEALPYFKRAVAALSVSGNTWMEANARYIYGYIYYVKENFEASREQFSQAAALFETYVDSKTLADVYYYWGDLEYYKLKEYKNSTELYEKAIKIYTDQGLSEDAASTSHTLAEVYYFYLGNMDEARTYYEKAYNYYKTTNESATIANLCKKLGDVYGSAHENDKAIEFLKYAAKLNNQLGRYEKEGDCYIVMANIYYFSGNYPTAVKLYRDSYDAYEKGGSINGMAGSYIGLANFYKAREEYEKAKDMYNKSLELYLSEKEPHYSGISSAYIGLGNIFYDSEEYEKALDYYLKSIEFDKKGLAGLNDNSVAYMNISNIYLKWNDDVNTEKYLELAIAEADRTKSKHRQGSTLKLRGFYYYQKGQYEKALEDCSAGLKIVESLGLLPEAEECNRCLYLASKQLGQYKEAMEYYQGYIAARDSVTNEKRMTEVNKRELQYEYEKRQQQIRLEEERKQVELREELKRKQLFFDFEAKQARIKAEAEKKQASLREEFKRKQLALDFQKKRDSTALVNAKNELTLKRSIREEQIRHEDQKRLNKWLFGGLGIFCVLTFIILKGYRDKQKANKIIMRQKEETEQQKEIIELRGLQLEEKNREIIDSINYARRLQEAILPPQKLVKQYLNNSFILYKPRDIVAGDFYWMEPVIAQETNFSGESAVGSQKQPGATAYSGNSILFAVADCTGHGVPGAMVSVVCSGALNRALKEFHLTEPGKILDKVRELVLETFEKSESEVKDGMDISLCLLNTETMELKWAGANNPLWILRKNVDVANPAPFVIMEYKANKQPIGKTDNPSPFTTHRIQLQEGDALYLSSDGYADQFGGEKGKKFKDSNLKKLLMEIGHLPMEKQSAQLNQAFEQWRGQLEQVDDICVVGVKV